MACWMRSWPARGCGKAWGSCCSCIARGPGAQRRRKTCFPSGGREAGEPGQRREAERNQLRKQASKQAGRKEGRGMDRLEYDLEFERPLMELAEEIRVLRHEGGALENPTRLQEALCELGTRTQEIYGQLSAWQTVQVARHRERPRASDYLQLVFDDFVELHGDRCFGDDPALIGGLASFEGETVVVVGHQKGSGARDQQSRNFGMPHPEGYRKASRLMQMAGKFKFPV